MSKFTALFLFILLLFLVSCVPIIPLVNQETNSMAGFIQQVGGQGAQSEAQAEQLQEDEIRSFLPMLTIGSTPTPPGQNPRPTPTIDTNPPPIPEGLIYVDHRSIELYDRIPENYLTQARNLKLLFSNASVGDNISDSLNCFTAPSWILSGPGCRRDYYLVDGSQWFWKVFTIEAEAPSRILFDPDPDRYGRSNWTYEFLIHGDWQGNVQDFATRLVPAYIGSKDILSYQFSYLNIIEGSTIADPDDGFFVAKPSENNRWDISDIEALEAQHPDKIFIYWTTSLARGLGTAEGTSFNEQMRDYAISNDKILFDVAAILSHDENGNQCYDNRDGVEYCDQSGECENFPDDGFNYPAICQDYTTELNGGHLGSVSGGGIRSAKALWVLMAKIAGWEE